MRHSESYQAGGQRGTQVGRPEDHYVAEKVKVWIGWVGHEIQKVSSQGPRSKVGDKGKEAGE